MPARGSMGRRLAVAALLAPSVAGGRCPDDDPGAPACVPIAQAMMPTVEGVAYLPRRGPGAYLGGGADLTVFSWSNNVDSFGPSQGALRLGVSYLRGGDDRSLLLYRFGALVSIEGNASRRFLIPTFGGAIGGLWESELGSTGMVEGSLGLYLLYTRRVVVDAQGGVVAPFHRVDTLLGPKVQLTASVSLW